MEVKALLPEHTETAKELNIIGKYRKSMKIYGEVEDEIGEVFYIDHMGSDISVVNAARVSYGKEIDHIRNKDRELIKYLIDNKHTSPFEHCLVTFKFVVPIFIARQHMRHRTWSYNEISRRYSSENIRFYEPTKFRKPDENDRQASQLNWFEPDMSAYSKQTAHALLCEHADRSVALYNAFLDAGVAREMARMVLPVNLYTEYYGTCDLHNLVHFLNLRDSSHAQWEIVVLAKAIKSILVDLFPVSMEYYEMSMK